VGKWKGLGLTPHTGCMEPPSRSWFFIYLGTTQYTINS